MSDANLTTILQLRDEMTAPLRAAQAQLAKTTKELKKLGESAEDDIDVLLGFKQKVKEAGDASAAASSKASKGFEQLGATIDKNTLKEIKKFSQLTQKVFALQFAIGGLQGTTGEAFSGIEKAVKVGTKSIQLFTAATLLIKGPIGIAIGSAAALATVFGALLAPSEKVTEHIKELTEESKKFGEQLKEITKTRERADKLAGIFGETEPEQQKRTFEQRKAELSSLLKLEEEITEKLELRRKEQSEARRQERLHTNIFGGVGAGYQETRIAADRQVSSLYGKQQSIRDEIESFKKNLETNEIGIKLEGLKEQYHDFGQKIGEESSLAGRSIRLGLISPLDELDGKLKRATQELEENLKQEARLNELMAEANKKIFKARQDMEAASNDEEYYKAKEKVDALEEQIKQLQTQLSNITGQDRAYLKGNFDAARAKKERVKVALEYQEKENDKRQKQDPVGGFNTAIEAYLDDVVNYKEKFVSLFNSMEGAMSSAFQQMMNGGKKFKDVMAGLFNGIKASFFKMVSDIVAKNLMGSILSGGAGGIGGMFSGLGGLLGMGGGAAAMAPAAQGQMSVSSMAPAGAAAGGLSSFILPVAGAATAISGIKNGNRTQGIIGGALAGSFAGPIGALVGGAIGGIASLFGRKRKKKKKRREEAAARAAEEAAAEAMRVQARGLLKTDVRNRLGGGLASIEGAEEVGNLFSGDISNAELDKFGGAANIVARKNQIEGFRDASLTVNPNITVNISGAAPDYDASRLANSLGYLIGQQIHSEISGG